MSGSVQENWTHKEALNLIVGVHTGFLQGVMRVTGRGREELKANAYICIF